MTSSQGQEQNSKTQVSEESLNCDDCGLGYGDCTCKPTWGTDEQRASRAKEIHSIHADVMREIDLKHKVRATKIIRVRVVLTMPSSLQEILKRRKGRANLSRYIERLLTTHSGTGKHLDSWGAPIRVSVTLPSKLVERYRTRAQIESTNLSAVIVGHLEKELYFLLKTG